MIIHMSFLLEVQKQTEINLKQYILSEYPSQFINIQSQSLSLLIAGMGDKECDYPIMLEVPRPHRLHLNISTICE